MPLTSPLLTAADLAAELAAEGTRLVVLDCRFDLARPPWGREEYEKAHVTGARFVDVHHDLASPVTDTSGRHPLPDVVTFTGWLGAIGITADTPIVAYDQGPGAYAARLWWLLRSLGHADVRVLDGGFAAWTRAGYATTSDRPSTPAPVVYAPANPTFTGWVTTDEVVRALALDTGIVVDARAADRYAGRNETIDPIAGHASGAVNHPFAQNLAENGTFLPPAALRQVWTTALAGRLPGEAIMMCGSGVTACHNLLALEHAGLPGARLYAGSYSEWIRDPSRGIVTGPAPR